MASPPKIEVVDFPDSPRYIYFVSYAYSGPHSSGTGRAELIKRKEITEMADIIEIETILKKESNLSNVAIINYQLLRKDTA
jgi:hypothetical protein